MTESITRLTLPEKAMLLVTQMKRNPDILTPYNDELMRSCTSDINLMYQEAREFANERPSMSASDQEVLMMKNEVISFALRCCSAYIMERKHRIKSCRWKYGGALPPSIRNNLSEPEIDFFNSYCEAVADIQITLGKNLEYGVDLMKSTHPPKTLFMQVRVRENYGEFETSEGRLVNLIPGTVHNLPRQDCEMLIKQGVLELAH